MVVEVDVEQRIQIFRRVALATAFVQLALGLPPVGEATWVSTTFLFWLVLVATSTCVLGSVGVLWLAGRDDSAELGMIGGFLFCVSWLPFVHGATTPGFLYGPNDATVVTALAAIPMGLVVVAPIVFSRRPIARSLLRRWHRWVGAAVGVAALLGGVLLIAPDLVPAPAAGSLGTIVVAVLSLVGCCFMVERQLRLARISRHIGSVAVASGFALIGTSALVWVGDRPYNAGFWFAHVIDIGGVVLATIAVIVVYRRDAALQQIVAPVVAIEPLAALELGLDPLVHRFVAMLEDKDPITRDHVIRCAELAMAVGPRLGVRPSELRQLGMAAILHDVGKLETPDEILTKPGRLTDDEREIIQEHAATGARLVLDSPALHATAPAVRNHHERWDGDGYPDGLRDTSIPMHARIVSVCDAFDAMANSRHYREGMGVERAIEILRTHAGSQWDPRVVDVVCAHIRQHGAPTNGGALAGVGNNRQLHEHQGDHDDFCGCLDALPDVRSHSLAR